MALSKGRVTAIVLISLAALWLGALLFALPFLAHHSVQSLTGKPIVTVEEKLGPPSQRWASHDFRCADAFPCVGKPAGGPVLLYASPDGAQAWYLYFDAQNILTRLEPSPPPPAK